MTPMVTSRKLGWKTFRSSNESVGVCLANLLDGSASERDSTALVGQLI